MHRVGGIWLSNCQVNEMTNKLTVQLTPQEHGIGLTIFFEFVMFLLVVLVVLLIEEGKELFLVPLHLSSSCWSDHH